jgi:hypothetical protein
MVKMDNKIRPNISDKYLCWICDVKCCKKSHYDEHILTAKHMKKQALLKNYAKQGFSANDSLVQQSKNTCLCGKQYTYVSGLSRHKKTCKYEAKIEPVMQNNAIDKELVKMIIKENTEYFKDILLEVCKKETNVTIANANIINNNVNNKFNLNVFLNETCKDALNLTDFVDSIKLQLSDLENVGKLGFVNGITNIIMNNLKALDIHQRPVHCSDAKREVMYVKDADKWEKENEEKKKLRQVVKKIANKNIKLLPVYKEKYPDCLYSDSKNCDEYNKIVVEAFGGSGNEDYENEDKILKKIAKEVLIDKEIS